MFSSFSRSTIMSSNQEQEEEQQAGPSGVSREETLALLGLDMSEDEKREEDLLCHELMEDSEEEELCNEVMDCFERQRAFQTQLLQQNGGGLDPQTPVEPSNLISTPLWIDAVAEWEFANAISLTNYVKRCGQASRGPRSARRIATRRGSRVDHDF